MVNNTYLFRTQSSTNSQALNDILKDHALVPSENSSIIINNMGALDEKISMSPLKVLAEDTQVSNQSASKPSKLSDSRKRYKKGLKKKKKETMRLNETKDTIGPNQPEPLPKETEAVAQVMLTGVSDHGASDVLESVYE